MSGLPSGWVPVSLGDVVTEIQGGGTPSKRIPKYFDGHIPFMTVKDMKVFRPLDTQDKITEEALSSCSSKLIPKGIPIVCTRMGLGKIVRVNFETAINQDLKALFLEEDLICTDFFEFWYRSVNEKINFLGTGTTVKGITLEQLKGLEIFLPPVAEQTRIAAKLDELLALVDTLKARLDGIPVLLKRFRQSVLAAAVSGRLTEEWREKINHIETPEQTLAAMKKNRKSAWLLQQEKSHVRSGNEYNQEKLLKKYSEPSQKYQDEFGLTGISNIPEQWLATSLDNVSIAMTGKTPSTSDGENWEGEIPFISPSQILPNGIIVAPERYLSKKGLSKVPFLPKGAVMIVCIGTIGKVGLLDRNAAFNQQINALIPTESIQSKYLFFWTKTLNEWLNKTSSAVVNAAIINKSRLCEAPCPLPSMKEQTEIIRRVEELFAFADQLEARVKTAQERIDRLTQSILAKAFRGELVPQDPNDEPASVLLERIKAQRAAAPKAKRGRKVSA